MSGHSHWAGIKHRKGINDAKKGQIFTKHGKLISIAAKNGGSGDPDSNFQLRLAIERARQDNMPKENIEKAIKRGTGEIKGQSEIQEIIYEGYGPGQVALLIKTATDNKNRALGEIRTILMKAGGKLVPAGSVSFLFNLVGGLEIAIEDEKKAPEMEMKIIEAGADDMERLENSFLAITGASELQRVKYLLEKNSLKIEGGGLIYLPRQKIQLNEKDQAAYEKLLEELDNQEDVQEIYDNL
ncbi:MAG: YebC/PmpR family DNA-binding transcriptional regulator [Candidatus Moranbacteria bacterium CG_4_9_14_3_um_filter_40_7]|nr:MAG: YebC/PmpR family DNA-binding transcriptional regulator [Candidatus Moranbacteria bacterium CG23_combo_of_CG06-09_8_20_14_all_40_16]PIU80973.1 MAG: YebC/PmpR family DNA-binding transcriptional regulator [Candidatus Moranbacteria bacterium CG06_land_8_20_14_3_00_40_12]PJA87368.1 MAG: YebC/PmpR family DNA-binding transcriptional regulator [Candidatus Moranbacteria bacterium CG_4_9_14_3_um_filter_40_7]